MNIKKLESATKHLQKIKELDAEIVRIESYAMQAANDEVEMKMSLDILDLKERAGKENKIGFDEDGSLQMHNYVLPSLSFVGGSFGMRFGTKPPENKTAFVQEISNAAALQIFGVLLYEKQSKRLQHLQKLQSMGFAI